MKKYFIFLLTGVFSFANVLLAQTNNLVLSTSTEAVGLHYNNQWGPGNISNLLLDVYDWGKQKNNSLSAAEYTIISSSGGFNSYLGGVRVVPDISSVVKHTNIPSDQFGVFLEAAAGNSTFSNATPNEFTFLLGGGAQYKLTPNVSWSTVNFRWGRVGSRSFYETSSGVAYFFNPQASQSLAVKRMLVRARVRQAIRIQEDSAAASVR